ncbi:MAG: hypothetical protein LBD18_06750 [Treponema sp.]|nr:hypothetical protein [Treponema sp.]
MKKNVRNGVALLLAAIAVLALSGCPQPDALSSDPSLSSITVAGTNAVLAAPGKDWKTTEAGYVYLTEAQLRGAKISASGSDGAIIYYAFNLGSESRPNFSTVNEYDLEHENYIWLEVFSANHDDYSFYKIKIRKITPKATGISVGGRTVALGTPAGALAEVQAGEVAIGSSVASSAQAVTAAVEIDTTVVKYAKITGTADPVDTDFGDTASFTFANNDWLYLKLTSGEDNATTQYYKIKVLVKNDSTALTSLSVSNNPLDELPAPNADYAGAQATLYRFTAQSGLTNPSIAAQKTESTGGNVKYGWSASAAAPEEWVDGGSFTRQFNSGDYVAVQVTSELETVAYYKLRLVFGSSDAAITGITLGSGANVVTSTTLGTPNANAYPNFFGGVYSGATDTPGLILLNATLKADAAATVQALGLSSNAKAEYTLVVSLDFGGFAFMIDVGYNETGAGFFAGDSANGVPPGVAPGAYLVVRVTSQDTTVVNHYAFLTTDPVAPTLASFNIGGTGYGGPVTGGVNVEAEDFGTPATTAAGIPTAGSVTLDAVTAAGASAYPGAPAAVSANITLSGSGASYRIAQTTGAEPQETEWKATTYMDFGGTQYPVPPSFDPINNGNVLWIEASLGSLTNYYKITVTIAP